MGTPIVFGSPEALQVIQRDRKMYGPRDAEDVFPVKHRWQIDVAGSASIMRIYHFEAFSKEAALTQWDESPNEFDDEETLTFDVERYEVTDLGKVKP